MTSNWAYLKIKDFCEFKYGKNLPADKRVDGRYPVYGSSSIASYHESYLVEGPGIIIGRKGTVGKVQFSKGPFFPIDTTFYIDKSCTSQNLYFLYYFFQLCGFEDMNSDAAVPGLNRNAAVNLKVKLPPVSIQKKIAAILSAYDDLIENNLERVKLLEEIAQITYEEWFVRMKFPGHEEVEIDSDTGLPEGWVKGRLDNLLELQRGFDLPVQNREQGEVPILASTGVIGFHSIYKVEGPGVVTGRSGTIGEVSFCRGDFWPLNTSLWVKKIHLGGAIFAYHFLSDFNLERLSGGSAVPSLDRKVVHSQIVNLPPKSLVNDFEHQMETIFEVRDNLSTQIELLKEARDILLPRLMTGMIDIDKLELSEALLERINIQNNNETNIG